ncbi:MAG: hypothetical protein NWF08_05405 [Candidatus Bathyarchaeota archaeon]|nr:hypothetical protein [Candidatus Bathyarchaeota archaeon]
MKSRVVIFLSLLLITPFIQFTNAESEPIVPYYPRISNVVDWLILQEVTYESGQTGYAASINYENPDYFRIYTDDNARMAMALTIALQYYVNESGDRPDYWDEKIKVAINFVLNSQTSTKDFYHYWQLPEIYQQELTGWQNSGELNYWNAAILQGLAVTATKMRWDRGLGVQDADFVYYDNVKQVVKDCLDTWQPISQNEDGSWKLRNKEGALDTEIGYNGEILAALVALSCYQRNLNLNTSSTQYANWAMSTASWLMERQELRSDRSWPEGGGYGGLYNNKDDVTQFSAANGRAIFGLAMYGLNIESLVQDPNPSKSEITELMKVWVDGYVARTHDDKWGPINRATSTGIFEYPKHTYMAATMGTGSLAAYNFLLNYTYYDYATNFYGWIVGNNEKSIDFQNAKGRYFIANYGFYIGIDDEPPEYPINYDSNVETNAEALQLMISLDDSSLAWKLYHVDIQPEEKPRSQGCFIATSLYGSPMAEEVQFLRHFRDEIMVSIMGEDTIKSLNSLYYSFSPQVAQFILTNSWIKIPLIIVITPILAILHYFDLIISIFFLFFELYLN